MRRKLAYSVVVALAIVFAGACGDDDGPGPSADGGRADSGSDGSVPSDGGGGDGDVTPDASDDGSIADGGDDAGELDGSIEDAGGDDGGSFDAGDDAAIEDAGGGEDAGDLDAGDVDAGPPPAGCGMAGELGSRCMADDDCGLGLHCEVNRCLPDGRPICGGFVGAECPPEFTCVYCTGCDYGPCLLPDEVTCICHVARSSFVCGPFMP